MACCVAVGCSNRSDRKDLSFYRFPKDPDRRNKWISAVNRRNWSPTDYSRLCSQHFISGEKSNNPLSPDYVPSQFIYTKYLQKSAKQRKAKERLAMKRKSRDQNERLSAASVLLDLSMAAAAADYTDHNSEHVDQKQQTGLQEEDSDPPDLHEDELQLHEDELQLHEDELHLHEDELQLTMSEMEPQTAITEPPSEVDELNEEQSQREYISDHSYYMSSATRDKGTQCNKDSLYRHLLRTDALCHLHTGLPLTAFHQLTETLLPFNTQIFELDPIDQLLMTLMKLKLNLLQEDLAERFGVSSSSVSRIVAHWIDLMETHMKFYVPWLSKETIVKTTPWFFRKHYPRTTCIVDFSEIRLKKLRQLDCWEESFIRYYDENTVKFMVAFAPCGLIMFISAAYGGRCSDQFIASDSGFLKYLHPLDEVMAERSFMIRDMLNEKRVKLIVPAFTKRGIQLLQDNPTYNTSIYSVTIHVERVISRLKHFRILSETMPSNLTSKTDQILRICAALCNLQGDNFHEELE